jgi:hypothetical protein
MRNQAAVVPVAISANQRQTRGPFALAHVRAPPIRAKSGDEREPKEKRALLTWMTALGFIWKSSKIISCWYQSLFALCRV